MKTVYIVTFLFSLFPTYSYSQTASRYNSTNTSSQNLGNLCKKPATIWERVKGLAQTQLHEIERKCCEKSLKIIKKYSYQLLSAHQTTCPKGTKKNMLTACIGTLHWCEPKTASSDSPYVPLKDLDKLCEVRGGCCGPPDIIKKNSYVVLNPYVKESTCPEGTRRDRLRCKGSLSWCVPEK